MLKNAYLQRVYDQVLARDPNAPEFHQCIREFLESLEGRRHTLLRYEMLFSGTRNRAVFGDG